jgi:hypothetical protein
LTGGPLVDLPVGFGIADAIISSIFNELMPRCRLPDGPPRELKP